MKALSLKQPWAELILQGRKTIETRTWNTSFRGTFLIHASKRPDIAAMAAFGFADLPHGCIVGEARITGIKTYDTKTAWDEDAHRHLALSGWTKRRYGYLLKDVRRLTPKPWKGMLNFFEVPPDAVQENPRFD